MPWRSTKEDIVVANGSNTTIDTISILDGAKRLNIEIDNSAHKALDAFIIQVRPTPSASFYTVANATSDFTTAVQFPFELSSGDFTTLAAGASAMLMMDCLNISEVKLLASAGATSDTTVDLRWQVR